MTPYYDRDNITIFCGDCLEVMKTLPDNSVDSIVTDPPYGLSKQPDITEVLRHWLDDDDYEHTGGGFMGKQWDSFVPGPSVWRECLRVLKPGGHLLAFAGTRTQDLMGISLRWGGFEIRDTIAWVYGSGFPKSLDIGKKLDQMAGKEREVVGNRIYAGGHVQHSSDDKLSPPIGTFKRSQDDRIITAPATPEAKQWDGWGTGLKPSLEPILLCRKPISEKTIAANVLKWGVGGINVDGCRIDAPKWVRPTTQDIRGGGYGTSQGKNNPIPRENDKGRFPTNLILSDDEEVRALFPETKSGGGNINSKGSGLSHGGNIYGEYAPQIRVNNHDRSGSAARFFYTAKASKTERNAGLSEGTTNIHPTVKPLALMKYLVRLVTPPDGLILDPFAGSGTTLLAAQAEGFQAAGIEVDEEYCEIAAARLQNPENLRQPSFFSIPTNGKVRTETKQLTLTLNEE